MAIVVVTLLINLDVCLWRLLLIELLPVRNGCSLLIVVISLPYVRLRSVLEVLLMLEVELVSLALV